MHKRGLIETLPDINFRLCSNYENFHWEIEILKSMFKHNITKTSWVIVLKSFWMNYLSKKTLISWLTFVLLYLGKLSLHFRSRLRRTIERDLPYCKLKVIFRSKCKLNTVFRFKDSLEKKILSGIICRYTCSNCKVTYYGKIFRNFYTRAAEHRDL